MRMAFFRKLMFWTKWNKKPAYEQYIYTDENFCCAGSYRLLSPEAPTEWAPLPTKHKEDAQIRRRSQTEHQNLDVMTTAVVRLPCTSKARRVRITNRLLWTAVRASYSGPTLEILLTRVTYFYSPPQLKGLHISTGPVQRTGAKTRRTIQTKKHQQRVNGQRNQAMEKEITETTGTAAASVSQKKVAARKACIIEIIETEEMFGNDLRIIVEEFYNPIMQSGLLKRQDIDRIFLNVEDLLIKSTAFLEKLKAAKSAALQEGDADLLSVDIGRVFMEAATMLPAFKAYCLRQGEAALLLRKLYRKKRQFRQFLDKLHKKAVLRRLDLRSFLLVPMQRITRYPLMLARLHELTAPEDASRQETLQAQRMVQDYLETINSKAEDTRRSRPWCWMCL